MIDEVAYQALVTESQAHLADAFAKNAVMGKRLAQVMLALLVMLADLSLTLVVSRLAASFPGWLFPLCWSPGVGLWLAAQVRFGQAIRSHKRAVQIVEADILRIERIVEEELTDAIAPR